MRLHLAVTVLLAIVAASPARAGRLPATVTPDHYALAFTIDLEHERFSGDEHILVQLAQSASQIVLNAADLDVRDASITAAGRTQRAQVSLDASAETVTLSVPSSFPKGPADIHIRYGAKLNEKLRGLYLSRGVSRKYAVTQFESTDARRAFPSFDEPAFKATFTVSATIDRGDTAISNGRIMSDAPGPGPNEHTLTFATTAKMSSYLVALAVGDFQCLEGGADGIPIRICATPDKKPLGAIALESAQEILKFYNRYYAIKYPFEKLDVVAVPDFAAGAMENTGAIFYRETDLLADTRTASVAARKTIASVLAHEMAHQWFGDLVTMQWWDDLWLNEGFATWMANHPLAEMKPEWNVGVDETEENQMAMSLDALRATRPVHARVDTPAEIEEAFDAIAYQKGAALLRMIEHYVGADTFRTGVNAYLQAHAYGNATSRDFWTAIAQASGKPIDRILPTFVNQPGVPVVDVAVSCESGRTTLSLSGRRFFVDPSLAKTSEERWQIPICVKTPGQASQCDVLAKPTQTIAIASSECAPWVFANAGAQGYYRTAYAPDAIRALAPHIEEGLTAPERLSLVADEWALVRAGRHDVTAFLDLAHGYANEPIGTLLRSVVDRIGFIHDYLTTPATRPAFEAWIRRTYGATLSRVGLDTREGDDENRRELRAALVSLVGGYGDDPDIARRAHAMVETSLAGGAPLDPTVAGSLIEVAVEHGDQGLFDALRSASDHATSPDERYRYLYALAGFTDRPLIERGLTYALSSALRRQDAAIYLAQFLGRPEAERREQAWAFIKAHWTELEPKITISGGDVNLVSALGAACDPAMRDDIRTFVQTHKLPAASRTVDQTLERVSNCIELRRKAEPALAQWLDRAR